MIINLPKNIKSEFEGYNYFSELWFKLKDISNSKIVFDFNNVRFFEANLCAIFGAIFESLETKNNLISVINIHSRILNVLRKNEFVLPYGFTKAYDEYDTTLIYKKFNPNADREFYNYITEQLLSKDGFPAHSELLGKKIAENIFELYENARTHGLCNYIHTCGQFFPNKETKPLHFTIVDKGKNIKENVSNYFGKEIDADVAIEWAMKKGNTTKTGSNPGGLGLSVIFEFIQMNGGKIQVISSNGYYEFSNNKTTTEKMSYVFDGTLVNLRFNLNDKNYYSLIEEIDLDNIF